MQMRRQAYVDHIDIRRTNHLRQRLEHLDSIQCNLVARRTKIPLNSSPITGSLLAVARTERSQLGCLAPAVSELMNPSHETDAH